MPTDLAPVASGPVPNNHLTLPEVVVLLSESISRQEAEAAPHPAALRALPFEWPPEQSSEGNRASFIAWLKREKAIALTSAALADGGLQARFWDHEVQEFVRLVPEDWCQAAFQDQIIRGGVIKSSVGERIERFEGARPFIAQADVLSVIKRRVAKQAPAAKKCSVWLEGEMRASPTERPCPKSTYRRRAKQDFNVSGRQFNQIWKSAIEETGASWNEAGRPPKRY
jgi:hypothetical protein